MKLFRTLNGGVKEVVFTSLAPGNSHMRGLAARFVFGKGRIPISSHTIFDSESYDFIDRKKLRAANSSLVHLSDQLWVFGQTENGMASDIKAFEGSGKPVKFFNLDFKEIKKKRLQGSTPSPARKPVVYAMASPSNFYYRLHINKFILDNSYVPINPFMVFDYFIMDSVKRNEIMSAHASLMNKSDEVWVFGESGDLIEDIKLARSMGKPVVYFDIGQVKGTI